MFTNLYTDENKTKSQNSTRTLREKPEIRSYEDSPEECYQSAMNT